MLNGCASWQNPETVFNGMRNSFETMITKEPEIKYISTPVSLPVFVRNEVKTGIVQIPNEDTKAKLLIEKLSKSEVNKHKALSVCVSNINKHNFKWENMPNVTSK
jgi:hypothetical protein